ncbi:MAG: hypothetical protein Q4B17_10710 [Lautropia sp.]|nr:hypothetical protein [Lautropia sp.]
MLQINADLVKLRVLTQEVDEDLLSFPFAQTPEPSVFANDVLKFSFGEDRQTFGKGSFDIRQSNLQSFSHALFQLHHKGVNAFMMSYKTCFVKTLSR